MARTTIVNHLASALAIVAILITGGTSAAGAQTVPAGTRLPVRFLDPITSGKTPPETRIRVQSLAPLASAGCVVVPAYVPLTGRIETSRAGRTALQRGKLRIAFDSIEVAPGRRWALSGILDSLEWSPRRVRDGTAVSGRRSIAAVAAEQLAFLLVGLATVPAAGVEAAQLAHRPRVSILPGEEAVIVLVDSLQVPPDAPCAAPATPEMNVSLPPLEAHATTREGTDNGDPINLVIMGSDSGLADAFARADWLSASSSSFGHVALGVLDAALKRQDRRAPMSPAYYDGRVEDLAFERASPSARIRHHLRLWKMEFPSTGDTLWAGAATEDVGLLLKPAKVPTHRIDARIDREREVVVRELLAGGCAVLEGYSRLAGAANEGTNTFGQHYQTDGLTAVVRLTPCLPLDPVPGSP